MNIKNNRRSKITKKIFQETLLELLENNYITDISIKTLCDRADLNRSTFYMHYGNQMELLREIEDEAYTQVESFIKDGIGPDGTADQRGVLMNFLNYVKKNEKLFKILLGSKGSQDFQEKIMELTLTASDLVGKTRKNHLSKKAMYEHRYRIAGCTNVIEIWIENGFDLSVKDVTDMLIKLSTKIN